MLGSDDQHASFHWFLRLESDEAGSLLRPTSYAHPGTVSRTGASDSARFVGVRAWVVAALSHREAGSQNPKSQKYRRIKATRD
jgi:hypothetical protein